MAPEVVLDNDDYDASMADMWSVGVVLYVMLAGMGWFTFLLVVGSGVSCIATGSATALAL